jgi:cytochrome c oxidase subunit II
VFSPKFHEEWETLSRNSINDWRMSVNFMPENISTFGQQIDDLTVLITIFGVICLTLAEGTLFIFAVIYRKKEGGKAAYIPGKAFAQLKWVLMPLFLIIILDEWVSIENAEPWQHIKVDRPTEGIQIGITAQQFNWVFHYPGKDQILWNENDTKNPDVLVVPINTNILFDLQARDVLHSFWVPSLRLKQDAIPGRIIKGWFNATKVGEYDIACAEICGTGHSQMSATLKVVSKADYAIFLEESSKKKVTGEDIVKMKGCTGCHNAVGPAKVGPTWAGINGAKKIIIRDGNEVEIISDENYIRESILKPNAAKSVGYENAVMPAQNLTDKELDLIVDYLKSLK